MLLVWVVVVVCTPHCHSGTQASSILGYHHFYTWPLIKEVKEGEERIMLCEMFNGLAWKEISLLVLPKYKGHQEI